MVQLPTCFTKPNWERRDLSGSHRLRFGIFRLKDAREDLRRVSKNHFQHFNTQHAKTCVPAFFWGFLWYDAPIEKNNAVIQNASCLYIVLCLVWNQTCMSLQYLQHNQLKICFVRCALPDPFLNFWPEMILVLILNCILGCLKRWIGARQFKEPVFVWNLRQKSKYVSLFVTFRILDFSASASTSMRQCGSILGSRSLHQMAKERPGKYW